MQHFAYQEDKKTKQKTYTIRLAVMDLGDYNRLKRKAYQYDKAKSKG